jgi:hypothetical protein
MHEIRVHCPQGQGARVAGLAVGSGIQHCSTQPVRLYGPERDADLFSAEVATPQAKRLLDDLFATEWFNLREFSVSTREIRALASDASLDQATQPMPEPALDVLEDLWQLTHVTPSYVVRAIAASLLLADGLMRNDPVEIVVAVLFLPYLSQILAVALGAWCRRNTLARLGVLALSVSTIASIAGGALVAALHDAPMAYAGFRPPLVNLAFSVVIGVTAGLCSADDTGRRYLINVAAAVQVGVFPVWFGIGLVDGFPSAAVIGERVGLFFASIGTIALSAVLAYAWAGMRRGQVNALARQLPPS